MENDPKFVRFKYLVKTSGVNVSELAVLAGYNRQHVTTIFNGKAKATPRFWALIRRGWEEYRNRKEAEFAEISALLETL